ncbi:cell division protein ZapA [Desulfurispirillum indicum]|uniref:cell division protein ZapA n=1 Tax=Desulfurispirillum indicum TaxID=936456 RepID=UPI0003063D2A|nr:cell division protein ZapA [Desulfurispirillum indicum]UCZ58025.1 cell division protein ZapA [Desulfurispirillum indicum]
MTINGQRYTLKGGSSREHVEQLADYVDRKFREVSAKAPQTSMEKVAVLVALNIAEELFASQRQAQEMEASTKNKTLDILKVIDGKLNL